MKGFTKSLSLYTQKFYCIKLRSIVIAFQRNRIISILLIIFKALVFFFYCIVSESILDISLDDSDFDFLTHISFVSDASNLSDLDTLNMIGLLLNIVILLYLFICYCIFIVQQFQQQSAKRLKLQGDFSEGLNFISEEEVLKSCQGTEHNLITESMSLIIEIYYSLIQTPLIFYCLSASASVVSIASLILSILIEYVTLSLVIFTSGIDTLLLFIYYIITSFIAIRVCPFYKEESQFWNVYMNFYCGALSFILIFFSVANNTQSYNIPSLCALFFIPIIYRIVYSYQWFVQKINENFLQDIFKIGNEFRIIDIDMMIRQRIFNESDSMLVNDQRKLKIFNLSIFKLNQQMKQQKEAIQKEQEKQTNQSQSIFQSTVFKQEIQELEIFQNESVDLQVFIKDAICKLCRKKFKLNLSLVYLVYLLENMACMKSYYTEFSNIYGKRLNLKEIQQILSVHSIFMKFKQVLQQTYYESSPFDNSILTVLKFEWNITNTFETMDSLIRQKVTLLALMKQKQIVAEELLGKVEKLRRQQLEIRRTLNGLAEINNNSYDLITLQICYLENLSFNNNEVKINYNQFLKGNQFSQKTRQKEYQLNDKVQKQKMLKNQKVNLFKENQDVLDSKYTDLSEKVLFDNCSCILFVAIEENLSLVIKNVSNNFCSEFEISKKDALEKRIEYFMPQNTPLAQKHKKYVINYFANQDIFQNNLKNKLLFGQTAKGFITPFKMILRLNYNQEQQRIGFSVMMRMLKDKSEYLMYNSSTNNFIGITHNLQQIVFPKFTFHKKFDLGNIFPFLHKIKVANKVQNCGTEWDAMMTAGAMGDTSLLNSDLNYSLTKRTVKEDETIKKYEQSFEFILILENKKDGLQSYSTSGQTLLRLINDSKEYNFYFMEIRLYATQYNELSNVNYMQISNLKMLVPSNNGPLIVQHLKENQDMYAYSLSKPGLQRLIQQVQQRYDKFQTTNQEQSSPQIASYDALANEQMYSSEQFQLEQRNSLVQEQHGTSFSHNISVNRLEKLVDKRKSDSSVAANEKNGTGEEIKPNKNVKNVHQNVIEEDKGSFDEVLNTSDLTKSKIIDKKANANENSNGKDQSPEIDVLSAQRQVGGGGVDQLLSPSAFSGAAILSDNHREEKTFVFHEEEDYSKILQEKNESLIQEKRESRVSTNYLLSPHMLQSSSNQDLLKFRHNSQSTSLQQMDSLAKKFDSSSRRDLSLVKGMNSTTKIPSQIYDYSMSVLQNSQQQKFFQDKSATGVHILDDFRVTKESQENLQISSKLKHSAQEKEQQKKKLERENLEIASTKSKESSSSTKRTLMHMIKAKQKIMAMTIINLLGVLTFLVLIIVTVQQYVTIMSSLQTTQDNIQIFDWPSNILNTISELQSDFNTLSLINQNQFLFSSPSVQTNFTALLTNRLFNTKNTYIGYLAQMESVDTGSDLFVMMENITLQFQNPLYYTTGSKVGVSSSRVNYYTETIIFTLLYAAIDLSQYIYRQAISPGAKFNEYMTVINLKNFLNGIETTQSLFQDQQQSLDQQVEDKLVQLLVIIMCVSAACLLIIIPVYSFIQTKKDLIINLFCTFPVNQIQFMISNIRSSYYSNKTMQAYIKQIPSEISNYNNTSLLEQTHIKKQTMSQISRLPRFKTFILVGIIFTYALISLYPIVNKVITQQYVDQQRNDLFLFTTISSLRNFIYNSAGMLTFTLVMRLYPNLKSIQIQDYLYTVDDVMANAVNITQQMQSITNQQSVLTRYNDGDYDNFFFKIFDENVCETVNSYPQFIQNATQFQVQVCDQLQTGFLQKGLKLSVQQYLSYVNMLSQIVYTTDPNLLTIETNGLFQSFNITDFTFFVDYIGETLTLQQKFLQYSSSIYFNYMSSVQTSLLIFQIVLMVLVFGIGWTIFSQMLNEEVNTTKQFLQVISIDYLLDNNYILTFVKNNHKI